MPAPTDSVAISAIPTSVVTAAGTDIHPVVQGGTTKQETNAQILTYIQANITIAESQVTNLVNDLNTLTTAIAGKQAADTTLTALAAYNSNGLLTQTAADTFVGRTIAGTASRILVSNGDGVAGNPTIDIHASYVGQTSITTLGTITTGTWGATAIAVDKGGTGLTSYAVGDLIYASGATTLAKLADVATGNVLISGGVAAAPSWGKVDLAAHVTGVLPSANGGTGVNNAGTLTNASNTSITGGGTLALGGFTLTVPATGTTALLATSNVFSVPQSLVVSDAATNTTSTLLTIGHNSTGTVAAAFGTRILFNLETSTTDDTNAAAIDVIWANATHGSRSGRMYIYTGTSGGLGESLRLESTGIVAVGGTSGTNLTSANLTLGSNGGGAIVQNNQVAASTGLILRGSGTIAATQYVVTQFGTVETARFDVASAAASTNAVVDNLILRRNPTSGTPAAGTGHQLRFVGKSDTTADRDQFVLSNEWVVATDASRTVRTKLSVYDTAAREAIRLEASGSAAMIGFLGASAAVRQTGGENVTNSVTDSGSTAGTIPDITDGSVYANDYTNLRRALFQIARLVKQDHDALRLYGLLT